VRLGAAGEGSGNDPLKFGKEITVRDVYEILRQEEMDCARLKSEIEALRLVIPLLTDEEAREQHDSQAQENAPTERQVPMDHFLHPLAIRSGALEA